jgi:hypothetical protein
MPLLELRNVRKNGFRRSTAHWFWCLLFGPGYFAYMGVWTQAAVSALLVIPTLGPSWLIYPFFARSLVRAYYLRRGWDDISRR